MIFDNVYMNGSKAAACPCPSCGRKCISAPLELRDMDEYVGDRVSVFRNFGCQDCGTLFSVRYDYNFDRAEVGGVTKPSTWARDVVRNDLKKWRDL